MSSKLPGLAVGVAQVHAADDTWLVQVRKMGNVCSVLWDLLHTERPGVKGSRTVRLRKNAALVAK